MASGSSGVNSLELGIIGNGTVAGLVDGEGAMVWLCLPRLDGEPVFNRLVGGGGQFRILLNGQSAARQTYIRNTAVLETILEAADGSAIRIIDFAPRFFDRGRQFRPASVVRRITPLRGMPTIKVELSAETGVRRAIAVHEGQARAVLLVDPAAPGAKGDHERRDGHLVQDAAPEGVGRDAGEGHQGNHARHHEP